MRLEVDYGDGVYREGRRGAVCTCVGKEIPRPRRGVFFGGGGEPRPVIVRFRGEVCRQDKTSPVSWPTRGASVRVMVCDRCSQLFIAKEVKRNESLVGCIWFRCYVVETVWVRLLHYMYSPFWDHSTTCSYMYVTA